MKTADEILKSSEKFQINLGLKRIKLILALLSNPQREYKIIHIAGTNGKGSTCKIINEILIEHFKNTSKKIGLYTSPHLFSYCERIKINNEDIREDIFDRLVNDIDLMAKKNNIFLTEFELLTACAFYYFYIKKVDYVILETGLGGKYDATNAANSFLQVITTIDFDHMDRLGNTINKIAFEKAGIIKENSKVIIDKNNLGFNVIKKAADFKNAKVIEAPEIKLKNGFIYYDDKKLINENEFNLLGLHQLKNLSLALCTIKNSNLDIKEDEINNALKNVSWRFRLEYNKEKNLLIDGAHNPSGVNTLLEFLSEKFKNEEKDIIFGCLNTKDYKTMIDLLSKIENVSNFYFFEFSHKNSIRFDEIKNTSINFQKINSIDEIQKLINDKKLTVICGSLYMLSDIFSKIG